MNEENDLTTRRQECEESVMLALQEWIDDFGDSDYVSSFTSKEDDRVQFYIPWGDAELVPNDGDEILEHAYAFCQDLAPNHIINEERVKAFVDEYIK